jgi:hypothetical protein
VHAVPPSEHPVKVGSESSAGSVAPDSASVLTSTFVSSHSTVKTPLVSREVLLPLIVVPAGTYAFWTRVRVDFAQSDGGRRAGTDERRYGKRGKNCQAKPSESSSFLPSPAFGLD